jgi:hypothetical protein
MKFGWLNETTYGTSAITTAIFPFGDNVDKDEMPIPWAEIQTTPVFQIGTTPPVNVVEGAKKCEFSIIFRLRTCEMFKYVLGAVNAGVFSISSTIPSFSTYIETSWGDKLIARGCVIQGMDIFAEWYEPLRVKIDIVCADVVETTITSPTCAYATGAKAKCWHWGDNDALKVDTVDAAGDGGEIKRVYVTINNMLKTRKSDKIVQVKKIGTQVGMTFDIQAKDKANLLVRAVRDAETNAFSYEWKDTADKTLKIESAALVLRALQAAEKMTDDEAPLYVAGGIAYGANAFKLTVSDGVTYT